MNDIRGQCDLVIAGPGTGKTYGMIEEITKKLPFLDPNRFLAAVTYTNAAAEVIHTRLQENFLIPNNVFIGTTHSFFNKFILRPYSQIFDLAPSETMFIDGINIKKSFSGENAYLRERSFKNGIANDLAKEGIICHDKTVQFSRDLIRRKTVLNEIANRLQMVFIDEYQDANAAQGEIFEALASTKKISMYFVGDPEQYIYSFGYRKSLLTGKTPEFENIPIMKLKSTFDNTYQTKIENRRSNEIIVTFINNFNSQTKQRASDLHEQGDIFFINSQDIQEIISKFNELCDSKEEDLKILDRLFLSYANETIGSVADKNDLRHISNDQIATNRLVRECLKYVAASRGKSQRAIRTQKELNLIEWRKFGLRLIKEILNNPALTKENLELFISKELQLGIDEQKNCQRMYERLINACQTRNKLNHNYYSTIHKAKGLEADAVLVICESEKKLQKWLEKDPGRRFADKDDQCRLGFVAFSRARKILCIGCLKKVDNPDLIFKDLKVAIMN